MRSRSALISVAVILTASLALAGCNKPGTNGPSPSGNAGQSNSASSTPTTAGANPQVKGAFQDVNPSKAGTGFPSDFPLYSTPTSGNTTNTAGGTIHRALMFTSDSVTVATKNYVERLKKDGYTIKAQGMAKVKGKDRAYVSFAKEGEKGFADINQNNVKKGQTRIVVSVTVTK